MTNSYKGYSLFNDVADTTIRAWNRCRVSFNINQLGLTEEYIKNINTEGKEEMADMFGLIKEMGYDQTRRKVFRELKLAGAA
jgi:hypothetical protein